MITEGPWSVSFEVHPSDRLINSSTRTTKWRVPAEAVLAHCADSNVL